MAKALGSAANGADEDGFRWPPLLRIVPAGPEVSLSDAYIGPLWSATPQLGLPWSTFASAVHWHRRVRRRQFRS